MGGGGGGGGGVRDARTELYKLLSLSLLSY